MGGRDFLTYPEYKAHCYANFVRPRPESETSPIVTDLSGAPRAPRDLSKIFKEVANSEGRMTRESLEQCRSRLRFEGEFLSAIFDVTGEEEIDYELFLRVLG